MSVFKKLFPSVRAQDEDELVDPQVVIRVSSLLFFVAYFNIHWTYVMFLKTVTLVFLIITELYFSYSTRCTIHLWYAY